MILKRFIAVAAVLATAGCALAKNTLAQDMAWQMGRDCANESGTTFERVDPDGKVWVTWRFPNELAQFQECWSRRNRELAARTTPADPAARSTAVSTDAGGAAVVASIDTAGSPVWKRGYEWAFRYDGPGASGTYIWSVDREDSVDGIACYVVTAGTRELFYRKTDHALVTEKVDGSVVSRSSPPPAAEWPLSVGKTWEQTYLNERPRDRTSENISRVVSIAARETVTVPAGTFDTFKVTVHNRRNGALVYEGWYAPAVLQWIKLRERVSGGTRERELIGYKLQ